MKELEKYIEKRNFNETPEPTTGKKGKKLSFVIQRHHASHLHYDFRLEVDGVLKSWAVPKGPSLNPADKRLAMMVEDHPLDYQFFKGIIPAGNYGAGVVEIWDNGHYTPEDNSSKFSQQLHAGSLKFTMHGSYLKGSWALVKIKNSQKGNEWLLIKHDDEYAVHEPYTAEDYKPIKIVKDKNASTGTKSVKSKSIIKKKDKEENIADTPPKLKALKSQESYTIPEYFPMLASLADESRLQGNYVYEKKYDGYRCIAEINNGEVNLFSRNRKNFNETFAPVAKALTKIKHTVVLDGEVIAIRNGKESFQKLRNGDSDDLQFIIFDILYLDGVEAISLSLQKRRELLEHFFEKYNFEKVHISPQYEDGESLYKNSQKENWEGVIAKERDSVYNPGGRSSEWLKIKNHNAMETLICGFTKPDGSRHHFGSLVLGIKEKGKLKYIGNCGTGFNTQSLKEIYNLLKSKEISASPFNEKIPNSKSITWVKPSTVCEVKYTEITDDHRLRHPVFMRLREDKEVEEINIETQITNSSLTLTNEDNQEVTLGKNTQKLTHLNKIFWPKEKYTKGDLIRYYMAMSPMILPFIQGFPVNLNRHPNGIEGSSFYQKDIDVAKAPSWLTTAPIHSESRGDIIDYLVCNDIDTLIYQANLGCIEINAWLATVKNIDHPEYMVIDLDPGEIDFKYVIDTALEVKNLLDSIGVKGYCKTSGSTGLHIYVYLGSEYTFDVSKQFAEWIAHTVHLKLPKTTSIERKVETRKKKIYIDFLQNRKGQTIAMPFSVRPKPGATVSFPLHWNEVNPILKISNYHIKNVPDLVKNWDNPWKDLKKEKTDINKVLSGKF